MRRAACIWKSICAFVVCVGVVSGYGGVVGATSQQGSDVLFATSVARYPAPHPLSYTALKLPSYLSNCSVASSKKKLRIGAYDIPATLHPLLATQLIEHRITEIVFERLFSWNPLKQPTPVLATGWSLSQKGRVLSFSLRRHVRWHDGKPFTAHDVAIIPKHRYKESHWRGVPIRRSHPDAVHPVGTGPFMFRRRVRRGASFKRNPRYWRKGFPCLGGVVFRALPDYDLLREVLLYGAFDVVFGVHPKDLKRFPASKFALHALRVGSWEKQLFAQHPLFAGSGAVLRGTSGGATQWTVLSRKMQAYWVHPHRYFMYLYKWSR